MGGTSSTINNRINNTTINKSDLDILNQQVNKFCSDTVVSNASKCAASSSQFTSNQMGDINVVGSGNKATIGIESDQDSQLSLQCIQQSIQQTNIGNSMAQSIMDNLAQSVSTDAMTKLVNAASSSNQQGMFANPFTQSSSKVNVDVSNLQKTETNRKLSNLISNTVANNVKVDDVKQCFLKVAQAINNKVGNINIVGSENTFAFSISSKQVSKGFATCQQLTQQTSTITNALATQLGLTIVDDTKTKVKSESESTTKAVAVSTGLEGVVSAVGGVLGNLLGLGVIGPLISFLCICCCCIILSVGVFFFMRNSSSTSDSGSSGTSSATTDSSNTE